ncbi:MAG: helix-turn-helix domain-containing protein [Ruminococcus sp.]|nr:helix-turn-helix domain-containing protein [Ruminococcus sp.]
MDTVKTGKFLKELRKEMGLTQEQLGEKVGVTNKTVSRWETGSYLPPVECLEMLSDIYGVSINEIVSGQRLSAEQFAQAAEENLSSALEMNDARRRAAEKRLMLTLLASTVIAMAIILLIPLGNGETVRGAVMIALVIALAFISNSVNIAALWLNNERFEKKDP